MDTQKYTYRETIDVETGTIEDNETKLPVSIRLGGFERVALFVKPYCGERM